VNKRSSLSLRLPPDGGGDFRTLPDGRFGTVGGFGDVLVNVPRANVCGARVFVSVGREGPVAGLTSSAAPHNVQVTGRCCPPRAMIFPPQALQRI
jgi:hypothetical protein